MYNQFLFRSVILVAFFQSSCVSRSSDSNHDVTSIAEAVPLNKKELSDEERSYVEKELPRLGELEPLGESVDRWMKLVKIACRTDDEKIVRSMFEQKKFWRDGVNASLFINHLFDVFSKNPKLFFKAGLKKYGSIENLAKLMTSSDVDSDRVRDAIEKAPIDNRDDRNSEIFLKEVGTIEKEHPGSYQGLDL